MPNLATRCRLVCLLYLLYLLNQNVPADVSGKISVVKRFLSMTQLKIKAQTRVLILVVDIRCHVALSVLLTCCISSVATTHKQKSLVELRDVGNVEVLPQAFSARRALLIRQWVHNKGISWYLWSYSGHF